MGWVPREENAGGEAAVCACNGTRIERGMFSAIQELYGGKRIPASLLIATFLLQTMLSFPCYVQFTKIPFMADVKVTTIENHPRLAEAYP